MTPLVRRFLKTAIAFLFAGLAVGLWLSAWRHLKFLPERYPSVAAHTHLLLVGFVMMMIMGVALWMFPRPASDDPRYRPERMELVFWMLALAVPLRSAAEILSGWSAARLPHVVVFGASALEVVAIVLFFLNMWPRIRSSREDRERSRKDPAAPIRSRSTVPGTFPPVPAARRRTATQREEPEGTSQAPSRAQ